MTRGAGTMTVEAPRVRDGREDHRLPSAILPPYMRRSPKIAEGLPVLSLRGLSTGDFKPALVSLLGEEATAGLSPSAITRLTASWQPTYEQFRKRSLDGRRYAYLFADGVHLRIRLEEDRLCTLVRIGVREDGTKERVAGEDGDRESTESGLTVLRALHGRGFEAPRLAIGDGALGFGKALSEVWPQTAEQRGWVHRTANILDKLPKRIQPREAPEPGVAPHPRLGCHLAQGRWRGGGSRLECSPRHDGDASLGTYLTPSSVRAESPRSPSASGRSRSEPP